jgi:predicted ferric reductase
MVDAFQISGILAGVLMMIAGLTGFFGPSLRKKIKGPTILRIHRWCGIGAVTFGLSHGIIFMLFLR